MIPAGLHISGHLAFPRVEAFLDWILAGSLKKGKGSLRLASAVAIIVILGNVAALAADPTPDVAATNQFRSKTFSADFTPQSVDLNDTRKPGFQWYIGEFFGRDSTSSQAIRFNRDGSITLDGQSNGIAKINTAAPLKDGKSWVGMAFGGGGYFEAQIAFNPEDTVAADSKTWPAFWSMAIEHLAGLPEQHWKGQPLDFFHFIEVDFFEYDLRRSNPQNYYGGAVHDWYGRFNVSCERSYCQVANTGGGGTQFSNFEIKVPSNTALNNYHKYGLLWAPATSTTKGKIQYFFDGRPTGDIVSWAQYDDQAPPPGKSPWTFGIIDQQHLTIFLQTGPHEPMGVRSVEVWQRSSVANLVR